jgi:phage major head subunit gpT-like protein
MALTRGDTNATLKDLTIIAEDTVAQTRPQLYPLISNVEPEEGAYTKVPVPANLAMPRLYEGERASQGKQVNVVQTYNQSTYELTIDIDSDLMRNAKAYNYSALIREATMSMVLFPDYLMSLAVIAGGTNKAYDGVAFYGATHKFAAMGSNTIDNLVSATGQTVTAILNDIASALVVIRTARDNQGRLLNPIAKQGRSELLIQCPAALEQVMRQALFGTMVPVTVPVTTSGTAAAPMSTNVLQGIAELYPDGYLDTDSASKWYLHYVGMPQRPFVFFENYGIQVSVLGFGSEFEVNNNAIRIGLKRRFVLGYSRFDRSVRVA